jgi:four helix bundle protein
MIYDLTADYPEDERFGLKSQIRRASISISSNIAEGVGRGYDKDFSKFLGIAYGSCCEVDSLLYLSIELSVVDEETCEIIFDQIKKTQKQIFNLKRSLGVE